jgi:hydrogenase expression/formation protein HypC
VAEALTLMGTDEPDDIAVVGDYVIVHVGYALNKLDPEEAEKTLQLFAQLALEGEG